MKLAVFLTHPAQYLSPWFRCVAQDSGIDLTVIYATEASPDQLGAEFGQAITWNIPLREGYESIVLRPDWRGASLDASRAWHLDARGINRVVKQVQPDAGLITGWHSLAQLRAMQVFRRRGIPLLYRGDTTLQSMATGPKGMVSAMRARLLLRGYAAYLAVGQRSREYLTSMGVPAGTIFDSPHAVDNERFAAAVERYSERVAKESLRAAMGIHADFVTLFVGKLSAVKRPLDIVHAIAQMRRTGATERVALVVAGGGALKDDLVSAALRYGVDLHMLGVVDQERLPHVYACADVLVLPSASETWGLVVNEAMACGVPCVVTDTVGCAPDLIAAGLTGAVVPVGDTRALSRALADVRERGRHGEPLAEHCRQRVARFSYARATDGLRQAMAAVCNHALATR